MIQVVNQDRQEAFILEVAGIVIGFARLDHQVVLDADCSTNSFIVPPGNNTREVDYTATVEVCHEVDFPNWPVVFKGEPWGEFQTPYRWEIQQQEQQIGILVQMSDTLPIKSAFAIINPIHRKVEIKLNSQAVPVVFDPFFHPLGVLLFVYLSHFKNGLMIHASGVKDGESGYLFTGLSGIGKSTMAGIWKKCGGEVINDDRLILTPSSGGFLMHNTPMPYYLDKNRQALLTRIFLLKQSPENYCHQLKGSAALVRLMANCIQHFHTDAMVTTHLLILEQLITLVPVYELGFKPDEDVVQLIRAL
jgi:hypothetical protein